MRAKENGVDGERRSDNELREVSVHLLYELQMFRATALGDRKSVV